MRDADIFVAEDVPVLVSCHLSSRKVRFGHGLAGVTRRSDTCGEAIARKTCRIDYHDYRHTSIVGESDFPVSAR